MLDSLIPPPSWRWIIIFSLVDFANRIVFGAFGTMLGPVSPYLAENIGIDIKTVSITWSFAGFAWMLGTLLSAMTFKQYLVSSTKKMIFFTVTSALMAYCSLYLPKSTTFTEMNLMLSLRSFSAAAWETAGAGILVYTMGPIKSRVLVMCHHFSAAFGNFFGPVVTKYYLPHHDDNQKSHEVCYGNHSAETAESKAIHMQDMSRIQDLFSLICIGHILCCIGYVLVVFLPAKMPVFEDCQPQKVRKQLHESDNNVCAMTTLFFFYAFSCSSERIYNMLEFIFGLCGPLKLSPEDAVFTDQVYNGGYLCGRGLATLVVDRLSPRGLLRISTFGCLCSAMLLAWLASSSAFMLYLGAMIFGLCVSVQFGSCYSWAAEHMDVVGSRGAVFQVGCTVGSSIASTSAAFLFQNVNPMAPWYMNLIFAIMQVTLFSILNKLFVGSNEIKRNFSESNYQKLEQNDPDDDVNA